MVRLKTWQWVALGLPIAGIGGFLIAAAGVQIHQWGLNWIWAIILIVFVGWRWLLVKWLRPAAIEPIETAIAELTTEPEASLPQPTTDLTQQAQAELQTVLKAAREDVPPWEDWTLFFDRCQTLVRAIARVYFPQAKRPLLNIYIPQGYSLLRGTVDDVDRWMQKLSPALNQITIGQAYEAYEMYQKLEPATRTAFKVWNWSQWVWNPAAALARTATLRYSTTANQQLLVNLGQILREEALKALGMRAIALYSGKQQTVTAPTPTLSFKTQSLRDILAEANDSTTLEQEPVRILLTGRTGAGKSSLINTLFARDMADVDVLPSTEHFQDYHFKAASGETLILWDAPGYEQINHSEWQARVLEQAAEADVLLLLTPATDPALQIDLDFLSEVKAQAVELPIITIVTQVDRLRPIREWQPPYDWQQGERPKETSIREAVQYRVEVLKDVCQAILPLVTSDLSQGRKAWGIEALSEMLLDTVDPAKQFRLARFLQDLETRTTAAAKIIEHYAFQMSTTQGLAALLKSPVLGFISTFMTGSSALAVLLAEKIPVEQSPIILGKLQMAYELFSLLAESNSKVSLRNFDLQVLWPLLLNSAAPPDQDAWAFGHALVEYWTQSLSPDQLRDRHYYYLTQANL